MVHHLIPGGIGLFTVPEVLYSFLGIRQTRKHQKSTFRPTKMYVIFHQYRQLPSIIVFWGTAKKKPCSLPLKNLRFQEGILCPNLYAVYLTCTQEGILCPNSLYKLLIFFVFEWGLNRRAGSRTTKNPNRRRTPITPPPPPAHTTFSARYVFC